MHRRSNRAAVYGATITAALMIGAGNVIGFARRCSVLLPGLAGAAMASYGTALVYKPAGVILGGLFLLAIDRQLSPRARPRGE